MAPKCLQNAGISLQVHLFTAIFPYPSTIVIFSGEAWWNFFKKKVP